MHSSHTSKLESTLYSSTQSLRPLACLSSFLAGHTARNVTAASSAMILSQNTAAAGLKTMPTADVIS